MIEGIPVVERIAQLPAEVQSLSIVTPPEATVQIVAEAAAKGIRNLWRQPGAESREAIRRCEEAGINVIADGSSILVVLGFREL